MPMPTMSPAVMMLGSNGSSVSSIRRGSPNVAGVAEASTYSHRGVMTPIPKETWLGVIRKTVGAVFPARPVAVWDNCASSSESHAEELAAGRGTQEAVGQPPPDSVGGRNRGGRAFAPPGAPMLPAGFALRTAAAEATTATGAALLRARFVDRQATAFELAFVERRAGRLSVVRVCHLDETEPTRLAGRAVTDEVNRSHRANRREEFLELLLVGIERQITDVESHCTFPCKRLETAGLKLLSVQLRLYAGRTNWRGPT